MVAHLNVPSLEPRENYQHPFRIRLLPDILKKKYNLKV